MLTDFREIRADLDAKRVENLQFADYFNKIGAAAPFHTSRSVNALAVAYSRVIDCTNCGNCCRSILIHINAEDRRRLATWLKIPEEKFLERYCKKTTEGWAFADFQCPFLENRKCTAYEARPYVCHEYPHLDLETLCLNGANPVNMFSMILSAYRCPIVYNVMEELKSVYNFHKAEHEKSAAEMSGAPIADSTNESQSTEGAPSIEPSAGKKQEAEALVDELITQV